MNTVHRWLELIGLGALLAALLTHVFLLGMHLRSSWDLLGTALVFLGAIALADLLSGCFHWLADRSLSPRIPWIGPMFVGPFRAHHRSPNALLSHDFISLNGNTALLCAPWAWLLLFAPSSLALHAASVGLFTALLFTNQIHKWSHMKRPPAVPRWLQEKGLILSPSAHAPHHQPPHDRAYCITTGWTNRGWFYLSELTKARHRAPPSRRET